MLQKTPFHAQHVKAGARMVPFGGWDMPIDYSGQGLGVIKEHLAVRHAAGLFDVSHMGEVAVLGPGALAFLQRVTSNDVARLQDGHAQYSALPMPSGAPVATTTPAAIGLARSTSNGWLRKAVERSNAQSE